MNTIFLSFTYLIIKAMILKQPPVDFITFASQGINSVVYGTYELSQIEFHLYV